MTYEDIERMWPAFLRTPFPSEVPEEVAGIELHELDAATAGCISTFVATRRLDQPKRTVLRDCRGQLQEVVPHLRGESQKYFETLKTLSDAVLQSLDEKNRGRY